MKLEYIYFFVYDEVKYEFAVKLCLQPHVSGNWEREKCWNLIIELLIPKIY